MLLFSATGITLNHAEDIEAKPAVTTKKGRLPTSALANLKRFPTSGKGPLPTEVREWLKSDLKLAIDEQSAELSDEEVYLALPRPGGDAWLRIDRESGEVEYELTDRGWISWLNDLHKGRHTGPAWNWFIDIFAAGCLLFSVTGLLILKFHAANRSLTWPIVGLGILIPALLALLFIH